MASLVRHPVTILFGENGSGKSTLLEAIAVCFGLNPEGGSKNLRFSTFSTESSLGLYLGYERCNYPRDAYFLRAESFYNVAAAIEKLDQIEAGAPPVIRAYGGDSLHCQSHGESFFALLKNRFGNRGLYLHDEPEAALSPSRLIIATHSPILAIPARRFLNG
nr:AAA family ATPase [Victivallis sp. Marseille-Q1083]